MLAPIAPNRDYYNITLRGLLYPSYSWEIGSLLHVLKLGYIWGQKFFQKKKNFFGPPISPPRVPEGILALCHFFQGTPGTI